MIETLGWSGRRAATFEMGKIGSCVEESRILKIPSLIFFSDFQYLVDSDWLGVQALD